MKEVNTLSLIVKPSKDIAVDNLVERLRDQAVRNMPNDWWKWPVTYEAHRRLAEEFLGSLPPCPDRFQGKGIVICAGGRTLFTNGYVCASVLRELGCRLPIQFWHFEHEVDEPMREVVVPLGVECINATAVNRDTPRLARILNGWELKPFAILHSPFREVLLLDADNVPVVDPTFLFDTPQYRDTGAIFWPDFGRLEKHRHIWSICEVAYRNEPEFESGQCMVDKVRCWMALNLAMHYNEHSDFYYKHIHGDKETFHMAFRRVEHEYSMPSRGIHALDATMCQHDFDGKRIFQHRNMDKWRWDGRNRHVGGFLLEDSCHRALQRLREHWSGHPFRSQPVDEEELSLNNRLGGRAYQYRRVGFDHRTMEFLVDGRIGRGSAGQERFWAINRVQGRLVLSILGDNSVTCHLVEDNGVWKGAWLHHERMPIELVPLPTKTPAT